MKKKLILICLSILAFVSCSSSGSTEKQENLVRELVTKAQAGDRDGLKELMPSLKEVDAVQMETIIDTLKNIPTGYTVESVVRTGSADLVVIGFDKPDGRTTLGIPVVTLDGQLRIGNDFRLRTTIDYFPLEPSPEGKE